MIKRIVCIVIALTCVLVSTSCNQVDKNTENVILKTASVFGEGDATQQPYLNLIDSFMNSNASVEIQDNSSASNEEWKKAVIESFDSADTTPDVLFFFSGVDARAFILADQVVSVAEIREQYPDYGKDIRQTTLELMTEFDGEIYALPVKGFWEGLFCNEKLFKAANLPLPTDWQTFENAITTFSDSGIVPIAVSLNEIPHYWIEHLVLSTGGMIEHKLKPKGYVPQSWVTGLDYFVKLYNMGAFPSNTNSIDNATATKLFLDGKAAMIIDGSWFSGSIADKENTVVLPIPPALGGKMEKGDIIGGFSSGFYISRNAWNNPQKRQAAVDFVTFMTSSSSIAELCSVGGAPAADVSNSMQATRLDDSANIMQNNAQNVCMPIDSRLSKEAWNYLVENISKIAIGEVSSKNVVGELAKINKW